jgi:hypothetical protein
MSARYDLAARDEYNGWKNYQTWNVALWIGNDENLYRMACDYCHVRIRAGKPILYRQFVNWSGLRGERTPDRVAWAGTRLDYSELNEMLLELTL